MNVYRIGVHEIPLVRVLRVYAYRVLDMAQLRRATRLRPRVIRHHLDRLARVGVVVEPREGWYQWAPSAPVWYERALERHAAAAGESVPALGEWPATCATGHPLLPRESSDGVPHCAECRMPALRQFGGVELDLDLRRRRSTPLPVASPRFELTPRARHVG